MEYPRFGHALAVYEETYIFAFGSGLPAGAGTDTSTDSIEKYMITVDEWKMVTPATLPIDGEAVAVKVLTSYRTFCIVRDFVETFHGRS